MSHSHQNGPDFARHESQSSNKMKTNKNGKKSTSSNPQGALGGVSAISQGLSRNGGRMPTQYINATTNDMLLGGLTQ